MASATLQELIPKFRSEWAMNGRFRVGVYVLLGTLWLYGLLVVKDYVSAERSAWEAMESKIVRARATAATADWATRAQEMKGALVDLESLLWKEGSVGLSQASFEERISQSFSQAGVPLRSIRASAVGDAGGLVGQLNLIELRARAQIEFRPATMYPWLGAISKSKSEKSPSVFIEALTVRSASVGQQTTAEMEVVGYAVKASANAVGVEPAGDRRASPQIGAAK